MVGLGNAYPVDLVLHAQAAEEGADVAGFLGGAEVVQLVQAGLELEAASLEAGGKAAGQVVLFQQQAGIARLQHPNGCHQAAVACADDHHVIGLVCICCHSVPPLVYPNRFRDRYSQCCSSSSLFTCL